MAAGNFSATIGAKITEFMAKMNQVQAKIKAVANDVHIDIGADVAQFQRKAAEVKAKALALARDKVVVKIEARITEFQNKINRIATNIRAFGELVQHTFSGLTTALLPALVPLLSNVGVAIANLGPMLGTVAGSAFALVGAFASAGAGAVAFGAVAIPTIKALFDENAKLTNQQAAAKASFDAFKTTYEGLVKATEKPVLSAFQSAMTAANTILTQLQPLFVSSAQAVAGLMEQLNQNIGTPPVQAFLQYLNDTGASMLTTFGQAFGNVFKGLGSMLVAFAPLSQFTAQGFLEMTQRFAAWADGLSASSKFQAFCDYVNTNMPKIRAIFRDVFVGIINLFSAFGDSSAGMMTALVDMMARFREWSATLKDNDGFQTFMGYVQKTTPSVLSLIGNLTSFIINLAAGMAPLGAAILNIVNRFLEFVNSAMEGNRIIGILIAAFISFGGLLLAVVPNIIAFGTLFSGIGSAIMGVATKFAAFIPKIMTLGTTITGLATRVLPMFSTAIGFITSPVGLVITAITSFVAILVGLYNTNETFRAQVQAVWSAIQTAISTAVNAVQSLITSVWGQITAFWNENQESIRSAASTVWNAIGTIVTTAMDVIGAIMQFVWPVVKALIESTWNAIKNVVQGAVDVILGIIKTFSSILNGDWSAAWEGIKQILSGALQAAWGLINLYFVGKLLAPLKSFSSSASSLMKTVWTAIKGIFTSTLNTLKTLVTTIWTSIKTNTANVWNGIKSTLTTVLNGIKSTVSSIWNGIKTTITNILDGIKSVISSTWEAVKSAVTTATNGVKTAVQNGWEAVISYLRGIDLTSIGRDVIQGLINGIIAMSDKAIEAVTGVVNGVINKAKSLLGINSPSRLFTQFGKWTAQGFAIGITKESKASEGAITKLVDSVTEAVERYNRNLFRIDSEYASKRLALQDEYNVKMADAQSESSDEALKIAEDYQKALSDLEAQYVKDRFDTEKSYVEQRKKFNTMSLTDELSSYETFLKQYAADTDEYLYYQEKIAETKKSIYDEMSKINSDYAAKMQDANQKLIDGEAALNKAYEDAFNSRKNALVGFAGIFDEIAEKSDVTGQQLISNLQSQVSTFKDWAANIAALAERGIDEGLLAELREMGPKSAAEIAALNSLTDAQLTEYSDLYREKSELARQQAEAELIGMREDTNVQIEALRSETEAQLAIYADEWANAISGVRTGTSDEFNAMVADMPSIGVNVIKGMQNGLSSMTPALMAQANSIAESIKSTIQSALDIHSPSRWADKFIGRNFVAGIINGFSAMSSELEKATNSLAEVMQVEFSVADLVGASGGEIGSIRHDMDRKIEVNVKVEKDGLAASSGGVHQEVHLHSPKHLSPSENARKLKRVAQDLALKN